MAMRTTKKKEMTATNIAATQYHMRKAGIEMYNKKSMVRCAVGYVMIGIGLATLFVPFTTIPLCMGGAGLVGYDMKRLIQKVKYEKHLLKVRLLL